MSAPDRLYTFSVCSMTFMAYLTRAYSTLSRPVYDTFARISLCLLTFPSSLSAFSYIRVLRSVFFILITVYCKLLLLEYTFSLP